MGLTKQGPLGQHSLVQHDVEDEGCPKGLDLEARPVHMSRLQDQKEERHLVLGGSNQIMVF